MKVSRLLPLIGIGLFIYILTRIDVSQLLNDFRNINFGFYTLALAVSFGLVPLKALKWRYLIRTYNINFPLWKIIKAWVIGFSIGQITPGKIGDFARSYYLKNETQIGKSLTTVLIDRVIDIGVLITLAIVGMFFFITYYVSNSVFLSPLLFISGAFVLFLFLLTKENLIKKISRSFYGLIVPEKFQRKGSDLFKDFFTGLTDMSKHKRNIFVSTVLGLFMWLVTVLQYYLIGLSLNLELTYFFLFMVVPITTLFEALPISFSGIGVRDISLIYFFGFLAIAPASAVSFGILLLISDYLLTAFGMIFWFQDPIKIGELVK